MVTNIIAIRGGRIEKKLVCLRKIAFIYQKELFSLYMDEINRNHSNMSGLRQSLFFI